MYNRMLDPLQKALINLFKNHNEDEDITLREIAENIGVRHPQTVLNKLNQLVLKGYFIRQGKQYRLIRESLDDSFSDIIQLPVFGFAQCGHQGKRVVDEYTQENIPMTMALLGTNNIENCFFVRAKGKSMEPKIHDGDLVLIRQQSSYEPHDIVFVEHGELPKLKKIILKDKKLYLESINPEFDDVELLPYDDAKVIGVVKKIIQEM
ncbi:LexA repressor [candidate division SR1 bacterium]|nr:LexA repressor [candidate division SR1 bacterium]